MPLVIRPEALSTRYRASSTSGLVPTSDLTHGEREALGPLHGASNVFGILRPTQAGLRSLVVDHETARICRALSSPTALPMHLADRPETVARLVLDGVLEVETGEGFVGGAEAHPFFFGKDAPYGGRGRTAELSLRALQYVDALQLTDAGASARRLYCYHRLPASPRWRKDLPDPAAVSRHLDVDSVRAPVAHAEGRSDGAHYHPAWSLWRKRAVAPTAVTYKIYVSPDIRAIRFVFHAVVEVCLRRDEVRAFKVGRDLYGLLRPDKLIVYLQTREAVDAVAEQLRAELEGVPAHGVPFTAGIDAEGLLSWGVDPPRQAAMPGLPSDGSWRSWIVMQLAQAGHAARTTRSPVPGWRFALDRVALDGVDTATWAPTGTASA